MGHLRAVFRLCLFVGAGHPHVLDQAAMTAASPQTLMLAYWRSNLAASERADYLRFCRSMVHGKLAWSLGAELHAAYREVVRESKRSN